MTRQEKIHLKTVMWRILRARKVVSYDDLQELSGASRVYAQEWMSTLVKREVVEKLSGGRYRLVDESATLTSGQKKPARKTCRMKMHPGKYDLTSRDLAKQPEAKLWKAIIELKQFLAEDLVKMKFTSKTAVYQYLALLVRANFLKKERTHKTCNQCWYILIKKTGGTAPVIGRAWFLFDPNTGETWDDIPEGEKINPQLTSKKNGLEDAETSNQAQTAT